MPLAYNTATTHLNRAGIPFYSWPSIKAAVNMVGEGQVGPAEPRGYVKPLTNFKSYDAATKSRDRKVKLAKSCTANRGCSLQEELMAQAHHGLFKVGVGTWSRFVEHEGVGTNFFRHDISIRNRNENKNYFLLRIKDSKGFSPSTGVESALAQKLKTTRGLVEGSIRIPLVSDIPNLVYFDIATLINKLSALTYTKTSTQDLLDEYKSYTEFQTTNKNANRVLSIKDENSGIRIDVSPDHVPLRTHTTYSATAEQYETSDMWAFAGSMVMIPSQHPIRNDYTYQHSYLNIRIYLEDKEGPHFGNDAKLIEQATRKISMALKS